MLRSRTPSLAGLLAGALALTAISGCSDEPDVVTSGGDTTPVVLDYSPTVSDAGALLSLAGNPDVDLLAVTLPSTGEADCEPGVRITRALLTIAGRGDVPIGCGEAVSAEGRNEWPAEWREAANHLPGVVLPGADEMQPHDAVQLLADVLADADEPVTVVAVAPLTNLALLLAAHPDAGDRIDRIVTMGGAVEVPGNVDAAPTAEWNYHVDPAAVRDVLTSGIDVTIVPLDATDDVPWTRTLISRIATSTHPVARAEHQIVTAQAPLDGIYLWDELAAVAALDPSAVTTEPMTLTVDDRGALATDPDGTPVTVATTADVDAATAELLRTLNGGEPLVFDELTDDEAAYFDALARSMDDLSRRLEQLEQPADATPRELAELLVETMWTVLGDVARALDSVPPPATAAAAHERFVDTVTAARAIEDELLAAIERAQSDDPWTILEQAIEQVGATSVDGLMESCRRLEELSIVHGGPALCELFGD